LLAEVEAMSVRSLCRATALVSLVSASFALSACSDESGAAGDGGTILPGADAAAVVPGTGIPGTVVPGTGAPGSTDGSVPAASDGALPTAPGAADSLWCKAKAVLDANCAACHGATPAAGAPMALVTYADTQKNGPVTKDQTLPALIKLRTHMTQGAMPPGGGLTPADLAVLDAWVDGGALPGADPTCAGQGTPGTGTDDPYAFEWPAECTEQYRYKFQAHGASANEPLMVPADQETHPRVDFDAPWGNAEVQSLAMKPITDNAKVLHHWILYATRGAFITGWAPGKDKRVKLPDDVGMYVPSGKGAMYLDMHYFNKGNSQAEPDRSGVEVCAVPKAMGRKNTATVYMGFGANGAVMAPANTMSHRQTKTCTVLSTTPVHMLTASPHAHTLAKAMDFRAKVGGQEIILHQGPFDFEEQKAYPVPNGDVVLNLGDTVTTTCVFDNPTNKNVGFGENTGNEMCFNFAVYYPMGGLSCL
jgi:mono/diheme cytochrome c family protein